MGQVFPMQGSFFRNRLCVSFGLFILHSAFTTLADACAQADVARWLFLLIFSVDVTRKEHPHRVYFLFHQNKKEFLLRSLMSALSQPLDASPHIEGISYI